MSYEHLQRPDSAGGSDLFLLSLGSNGAFQRAISTRGTGTDGDGMRAAGEPGIGGMTVRLFNLVDGIAGFGGRQLLRGSRATWSPARPAAAARPW